MFISFETIERQARFELEQEEHRAAVAAAKVRLRARSALPWWRRAFPYRVTLEKIY